MRTEKEQQVYEDKFPHEDEFLKKHKHRSSFQFYPKDTIHFINALRVLNRHSELHEFIYELKKVMAGKTDEESVKAIKDAMEKKLKGISQ